MQAASAIVLVVDRLGAGWIGPYGNTWLDTPNFNRLAARSVLCEAVITDSPHLDAVYASYWAGRHAMAPADSAAVNLATLATTAGKPSILLTDDAVVAEHSNSGGFAERRILSLPELATCATEIEQTGLYAFFDAARDAVACRTSPGLLWLHLRGMSGSWDAPLELRYQFADEDDPQPPNIVRPPEVMLGEKSDPDEVLGYVHAYAGQVALLDMCLGMLLDAIDEHPHGGETLLIVTSPRGYPLGEHRRIGPCDEALYGELLHVPLLVRFPNDEYAMQRSRCIVQPGEVFSLIANAYCSQNSVHGNLLRELESGSIELPGVACTARNKQRAIRTPAWFLRESQTAGETKRELFAKPDDRCEANEVSSRCSNVVEVLAAELDRFENAARDGRLAETPPLAEILCDVWR